MDRRKNNRRFGEHAKNKPSKKSPIRKRQASKLLLTGFLLGLFFENKDGGYMFFRNVG
jgi:hypothetical protein